MVGIDCGSFAQKAFRIFTWSVDRVYEPYFRFTSVEDTVNKIDIVIAAAGILDFAPAEVDLALDSSEQRLLSLSVSRLGNIFCDEILCVVEEHPVWFTIRFIL